MFNNYRIHSKVLDKTRALWSTNFLPFIKSEKIDNEFWDILEESLYISDVGIDVASFLIEKLHVIAKEKRINETKELINILKNEMIGILDSPNNLSINDNKIPHVFLIVGINGVGKTTTIAKLAKYYQLERKNIILGAADTFRAGAIEQLKVWGDKINVNVVSHEEGSDPAAVAYDTVNAAISRKLDIGIIDTAGRLHTKTNLMEELKKIKRSICKLIPENQLSVLIVLDSTIGQNGLTQAEKFTSNLGCDGILLTKLDGTSKGGIVFSVVKTLETPICFLGTGESLSDLVKFNSNYFVNNLFSQDDNLKEV
ncbi:MAG: signal recognition particle-docking protein FtsY [SAR202 cluster bacterium]|nr:signal recognition particle-docking protein FtsY [SAR202 cluster bacterium]